MRTATHFLALASALSALPAIGYEGKVVGIHDGDTLTILVAEQQVKVRLASIDAPELGQAFGARSRQSLAEICHHQLATVTPAGRDRYGRTIGAVECSGVPAGPEQVRRGMAWVYVRHTPKGSPLFQIEIEARGARRGLWADISPTPPWEFRPSRK